MKVDHIFGTFINITDICINREAGFLGIANGGTVIAIFRLPIWASFNQFLISAIAGFIKRNS